MREYIGILSKIQKKGGTDGTDAHWCVAQWDDDFCY